MREIRILPARGDAGACFLLRQQLVLLGVPEDKIVETRDASGTRLSLFVPSRRQSSSLARRIRGLRLDGVRVADRLLRDSDWKTRWKRYFKPFDITPEVRVVPASRLRKGRRSRKGEIIIDTSVAFGTGLHATTRMMCGYIRSCRRGGSNGGSRGFRSFLDIGTGSGILAIVAARYCARTITAMDIDPQAVMTARRNCTRNACRVRVLTADFGRWNAGRRFDFVAANLLSQDLIRLRSRLVRAVSAGGYLAVSGVFADNIQEFRKRFLGRPFRLLKEHTSKKWYSALLQSAGTARNRSRRLA
jgi:ribosomal protein L11 methyltransferase